MIPCSNAVVSLWTMLYSKLACRTQGGLGMMTCSTAMVALETLLSVKPVFILSSCSANPINICGYRITKTCLNSWSSLNVVKTHIFVFKGCMHEVFSSYNIYHEKHETLCGENRSLRNCRHFEINLFPKQDAKCEAKSRVKLFVKHIRNLDVIFFPSSPTNGTYNNYTHKDR